jgi:lysozyme
MNENRELTPAGANLVKHFEGCLQKTAGGFRAYKCPADVLTIGWGHTNHHGRQFKASDIWTKAECDKEFLSDVDRFVKAVRRLVTVPLEHYQFDALVSFCYNCGEGNLQKSTLLKKVNAGDFAGAALEFPKWNKGGGRELAGLTRRRASEALLFQNIPDENYDGKPDKVIKPPPEQMPQSVDAPIEEKATMSEPIKPMVVDLSHWDPAKDYAAVKRAGIVSVIYKATQGTGMADATYVDQQQAAKKAGLRWGAYHFADGSNVDGQVANFMGFACPDPDELFALDWEDNPGGTKMTVSQVKDWVTKVEGQLGRPGECVIYAGNTAKEALGNKVDPWFGSRRLWLCQYGSTPVVQASWTTYWLWQYTDGKAGPSPHSIDGIGPCDINSYKGTASELAAEWASGTPQPEPAPGPEPEAAAVYFNVTTSGPVAVNISVNGEVIYGSEE